MTVLFGISIVLVSTLHFSAVTRIRAADAVDNPETLFLVKLKLPRVLSFTFLVWLSVRLVTSWRRSNGDVNRGAA